MKLGISTYCLSKAIANDGMSLVDAVEWIAGIGADHVEIVPCGSDLSENPNLVDEIKNKAQEVGLEISNYCVGANFIADNSASVDKEIERVKAHVDVANRLGVKLMRHDVASVPKEQTAIENFQNDFPVLVAACQQVADYAKQYGITTSVENHGFYVQASDRVRSFVKAVGRDNYKTTIDIGNFLCADEKPLKAVKNNLPICSMIHFKDFYVRPPKSGLESLYAGWIQTVGGYYLRGSIFGQGDLDTFEVVQLIKSFGYDGHISIEFEGQESCLQATETSFKNARLMWEAA